MIGIVNYQNDVKTLKNWSDESTLLKLRNIQQIFFYDGKLMKENIFEKKDTWFLLEMTDGRCYAYIEIQIDKCMEMDSNVLNVKTVYEYLKNLMYVDKREWDEFFFVSSCESIG